MSLLEFNAGPDLKMTGDRLDYVIGDMLARMADIVLAPGTFPGLSGPCAPYMQPVGT